MNKTIYLRDADDFSNLIIKQGFTQRKLAKEAGCSQTTISLIAKGERNPSAKVAVDICKVLNIGFDTIFFIVNNDKSH